MDDDASVEQELSGMIKSDIDSLKKSPSMQSFHNDQVTIPSKDATVAVRHSLEAMQLFAQMQYEIDKQLIDIERRKKELIQSYLEATNARLKQELLDEEEESFLPPDDIVDDEETSIQQMKRKRDVDIDDETSMEQNVKKKRRRLSRRMAVLLSDDDDDIIASSPPPSNMMDTAGPIITKHRRRTLEIDDADILSLWNSSPVWIGHNIFCVNNVYVCISFGFFDMIMVY